jgi:ABC-type dipeptide/oligopeptide/nickel transport system ATPase component
MIFQGPYASVNPRLRAADIIGEAALVHGLTDRVAIMYLGRIVEVAPAEDIFARRNHPCAQALLAEVPRIDTRGGGSPQSRARFRVRRTRLGDAISIQAALMPCHAARRRCRRYARWRPATGARAI